MKATAANPAYIYGRSASQGPNVERIIAAAWLVLAAVHVTPTVVLLAPSLAKRLYGVAPEGEAGVLIAHRGSLFLAVVIAAAFAALEPSGRRLATLVVGVSVLGFLFVYARAGLPSGALRTIALTDAMALLPLALVARNAWTN